MRAALEAEERREDIHRDAWKRGEWRDGEDIGARSMILPLMNRAAMAALTSPEMFWVLVVDGTKQTVYNENFVFGALGSGPRARFPSLRLVWQA